MEFLDLSMFTEEERLEIESVFKTEEKTINTRDVVPSVGVPLLARGYDEKSNEEKLQMIDEELKLYIARKIALCGYFISDSDALNMELPSLLAQLYELCNNNRDIIEQITHYIKNIFSDFQGICILWWIENDEKYIEHPQLNFKEGMFNEIITHEDTDPMQTFNLIYEYFKSKMNKKIMTRERVMIDLPKNGD